MQPIDRQPLPPDTATAGPGSGGNDPSRRRYGQLSFDETLQQSYEREDERYSGRSQATDWLILVGIGAVQFLWMLVVFLVEPGIR